MAQEYSVKYASEGLSSANAKSAPATSISESNSPSPCTMSSCPGSLAKASADITFKGKNYSALTDFEFRPLYLRFCVRKASVGRLPVQP